LKTLRKNKKWSYTTLSKKLDCPIDIIKLWESGEMTPTENDLVKIAYFFDIDVADLYLAKKDEKELSILTIIILFIIGCVIGILIKNIIYTIILPILNIALYLCIYNLCEYKTDSNDKPKSLFGFNIAHDEIKIYLYESNIIAIMYTYLSTIFRILKINFLVPNINIISEKNVNSLLIIIIAYLLLMI
ncbi:MAG: helix-turn-helix transcriptional regulator, partial [Bacilli bacterium]|nr:helix-turn-helix transcriptional regulator [Bacilli bacterium]